LRAAVGYPFHCSICEIVPGGFSPAGFNLWNL